VAALRIGLSARLVAGAWRLLQVERIMDSVVDEDGVELFR
jgi:hypothetical protein